ncbi:MAG: branched-chain amino acid ABC transporter permease [Chloroflexi bacterium]|nr:branched-chain amino acid ABC transporter permease [Chloroflexota bacterium]
MVELRDRQNTLLAIALAAATVAYLGWKIAESPEQALQFAFNGLSVGAVYALLAMGFTLVYSTVWFFDLYYGAAAAIGAYGVYYLRSQEALGGQYEVSHPSLNIAFGVIAAGVVAWALHTRYYRRLSRRYGERPVTLAGGAIAALAGVYTAVVLTFPTEMNTLVSPALGVVVALIVFALLRRGYRAALGAPEPGAVVGAAAVVGVVAGGAIALAVAGTAETRLYLSWAVSCLLAGAVGLALYRGLYVYMLERARSPLIMLVATLGVLLALTAATTIVFEATPRPLPEAFGSDPWTIGGANIKGFNVFTIVMAFVGFAGLWVLLRRTSFGKSVRAVGDDEEVSKVVGINTTVVIAVVFFIGAAFAAFAGIVSGHDTAIQPRMGLLLLLKGWIASVVGGIGNLYGAIVGGFVLGMIEQFGIWDLAGEWRDVVSFAVLILFLSFWPKGLLPRRD